MSQDITINREEQSRMSRRLQFRGHHTEFFGVRYGVPGTTQNVTGNFT